MKYLKLFEGWSDQYLHDFTDEEKFTIEDIESAGVLPEVLEFHLGSGNRINQAKTRKARDTTQNKTKKIRGVSTINDVNVVEEEEEDE